MKQQILVMLLALSLIGCSSQTEKTTESTSNTDSTEVEEDYTAEYAANTNAQEGSIVPDFSVTTIDGEKITISELKGKTIFINFFALSCPICMKELPVLQEKIWDVYKDNDNIVILSIAREHTTEEMIDFRDKKAYRFPIAPDPDRSVYAIFAEKYIPRNIIIDKNGVIVHSKVGYNDEEFAKLLEVIKLQLGGI